MTQEDAKELEMLKGNVLIREFMKEPTIPVRCSYHSSWDWLMPSWGKLSSLLLARGLFDVIEEFKNAVAKNDINAAWGVVIKGINLINE